MKFLLNKTTLVGENPTDTYRIHLELMHGDADHDTTATRDLTNTKELEKVVDILKVGFDYEAHNQNKMEEAIEKVGLSLGVEDANDIYSDLVGDDVTYMDCLASIEKLYVTWFNGGGVEYDMSIELDNGRIVDYLSDFTLRENNV